MSIFFKNAYKSLHLSDIYMCGGFSVCVGYLPPSPLLPSLFKFHKIDFRKNKKIK